MKKIFYSIVTKNESSKLVCEDINKIPSNQCSAKCYEYEGGGIFVQSNESPMGLKKKLERILKIELGNPQDVND